MYIESLVILLLILILFIWAVWYNISTRRLIKKYNPDDDKSRKGEEKQRGFIEGGEPKLEDATDSLPRPPEPSERTVLETTGVNLVGEDGKLSGTSSKGNRKPRFIFRRRKH